VIFGPDVTKSAANAQLVRLRGVSAYLLLTGLRALYAGCAKLPGWAAAPRVTFFNVLTNEKARIAWGEIGLSAIVALVLALLVSAAANHNSGRTGGIFPYTARSISDATSPPSRMTSEVTYIHRRRTMTVPSSPYVAL
jgi:hypothetical protein